MSTTLFWTLLLCLIGIIIFEILIIIHKVDPWLKFWNMNFEARKKLMQLEKR